MASSLPDWHPYKNVSPREGQRAQVSPPVVTTALTALQFGDSISADDSDGGSGSSNSKFYNIGHLTVYNTLSNYRFKTDPTLDIAVAGESTPDILTRVLALDGSDFDIAVGMTGINDIKNLEASVSTIVSNISAMYNHICLTLGKRAVGLYVLPNSNWQGGWTSDGSTGKIDIAKVKIKTVNRFLEKLENRYMGRYVSVDTYTNIADTGSTPVDNPLVNTTFDGIHENNYGAFLTGQAMDAQLDAIYPSNASPDFTAGIATNGLMTGTAGSLGGSVTGQAADGWTVSGTGGVGTYVASKVSGKQQMALDLSLGTIGIDAMNISQAITTGFTSGDTVYAAAMIEVVGTPVNIYRNELKLVLSGTGLPFLVEAYGMANYDGAFEAIYGAPAPIAETYLAAGQYLVVTPDLPVSGTGLTLTVSHSIAGRATAEAKQGTIQITGIQVFKR